MKTNCCMLAIICFVFSFSLNCNAGPKTQTTRADNDPVEHERTGGALDKKIRLHERWLQTKGESGEQFNCSGCNLTRANLSGANLSEANLFRADLSEANLSEADLFRADLSGANLSEANLFRADLSEANLSEADLFRADLSEANLSEADLFRADLSEANLSGASLIKANLSQAKFIHSTLKAADLSESILYEADFSEANCAYSNFSRAKLFKKKGGAYALTPHYKYGHYVYNVNFTRAYFLKANFTDSHLPVSQFKEAIFMESTLNKSTFSGSNFYRSRIENTECIGTSFNLADFKDSILTNSDFAYSNFYESNLTNANLINSNLTGTNLTNVTLDESKLGGSTMYKTIYESTKGTPSKHFLGGIKHIETLTFSTHDGHSGINVLRSSFKDSGFRESERKATYAIEHGKLQFLNTLEIYFRLLLFEWPCDYGYSYGRPFKIIIALLIVFAAIYTIPLKRHECKSGIYKVWNKDRLPLLFGLEHKQTGSDRPERITPKGFKVLLIALYFSLLSATRIGWRDLNFGNWIINMQYNEYNLKPTGWIRTAAGVQSLISVYLLALWVLTYFGRPFD